MRLGLLAYFFGKLEKEKIRTKAEIKRAKKRASQLPKAYNYYCPQCLFQTNRYSKFCPRCKRGRLKRVKVEIKKSKIEFKEEIEKAYEYYCPHCIFQTNKHYKICPKCGRSRLEKVIQA